MVQKKNNKATTHKKKVTFLEFVAYFFLGLGILSLALSIYALYQDGIISSSLRLDVETASRVGDYFSGAIGIFWSVAGVLLLFATLKSQRTEFSNTQEMIRRQNFETAFHQMLQIILQIKNTSSKQSAAGITISGDDLFKEMNESLKQSYRDSLTSQYEFETELNNLYVKVKSGETLNTLEKNKIREQLNSCYLVFHQTYHSQLSHYLRYIQTTIEFVIHEWSLDEDRKRYLQLIQAQMNDNELSLLFYHALSEKGENVDKVSVLFDYVDRFAILKNVDKAALIDPSHHILYPRTLFSFLNVSEKEERNKKLNGRIIVSE